MSWGIFKKRLDKYKNIGYNKATLKKTRRQILWSISL
nr:MAG TPA: hypothetical protein [Caudoviricetes sp.]